MKINHVLCLILAMLLSAGCATTENYEKLLQSWVGVHTDALVEHWGVPSRTYEGDEFTYYAYSYSYDSYMPGTPPTFIARNYGGVTYIHQYGGTSGYIVNSNCEVTFRVDNNTKMILDWRYQGNDCRVSEKTMLRNMP